MAVYEFECQDCGERFELVVPISEHDRLKLEPPKCPKCSGGKTTQVVSLFSCKVPSGYA